MLVLITFFRTNNAISQTFNIYELSFSYKKSGGQMIDTLLSRIEYKYWSKSLKYPTYVQWKGQPFSVLKSPLDGVGLFTDSLNTFSTGQIIGTIFYKVSSGGTFQSDYIESNIGTFINDSNTPNAKSYITPQGIIIKATQNILKKSEITVSYQDLMNLFPNDMTVVNLVKYWK